MIWRKTAIHTTTEAEEILSAELMELGIEGVQLEDKVPLSEADTKGMFIDILPDLGPDDGQAVVSFYAEILDAEAKEKRLEEAARTAADPSVDASYSFNASNLYTEEEYAALLDTIREMLSDMRTYCDIGEGRIETGDTEDKDWINTWKSFFHPFVIDDILIRPTWEETPDRDRDKLVIQIDPGTAFGTGMHETTQLCIRQLRKYLKPGMTVADIGTGSGILGITALKLGAGQAAGTDLDEEAVTAVRDNLEANGIPADRFGLRIGNVIGDEEVKCGLRRMLKKNACGSEPQAADPEEELPVFDIVVANILAPVIVLLTGETAPLLRKGGIFITSGIIDTREDEVLAAFRQHAEDFEILEVNHQGEWVSVTARRR